MRDISPILEEERGIKDHSRWPKMDKESERAFKVLLVTTFFKIIDISPILEEELGIKGYPGWIKDHTQRRREKEQVDNME
ncbi:hypothetical protein HNY73_006701 [Argiope bruennichi]|uniref:Uncharacterized protein n=1 Tax=Argiope bruennichi TaxID=94029 RepID=A0A8T0FBQ1_ARGBR|nr:hypothetical protein HNY73_006701 [Argiope bruennichi]